MKIIAFDPGRCASYAILDSASPHLCQVGEISLVGAGRLLRPCPQHISEVLEGVEMAVVEEVGARPKQGVSSVFTFGLCTGAILNAIGSRGIGIETVTPAVWKKSAKIHSSSDEEVKSLARAYATQLWPLNREIFKIKGNHGQAEAALMARWYFLAGPGREAISSDDTEALKLEAVA